MEDNNSEKQITPLKSLKRKNDSLYTYFKVNKILKSSGTNLLDPQEKKNNLLHQKDNSHKVFQNKWLVQFSWLKFNEDKNKMTCEVCVNYNKEIDGSLENVFIEGHDDFRKQRIKEHSISKLHNKCSIWWEMKEKIKSAKECEIETNNIITLFKSQREKLSYDDILPLFKNIFWISKENVALIKFETLNELLEVNGLKFNSNYRNRTIGKEMMDQIAETLREKLFDDLVNSSCFSIMFDSSTNISSNECLVIHIKYISVEGSIMENFLKILNLSEKNATYIYQTIYSVFNELSLNGKIIAMATDGDKTVSSRKNGVYGKYLSTYPYILHTHCVAHRNSLCIKDLNKDFQRIESMNKLLYNICSYFKKSPKRLEILKKNEEIYQEEMSLNILKPIDVRWISYYPVVVRVIDMYNPIVTALQEINQTNEKDALSIGLFDQIVDIETLLFLHFYADILKPNYILSKYLQAHIN